MAYFGSSKCDCGLEKEKCDLSCFEATQSIIKVRDELHPEISKVINDPFLDDSNFLQKLREDYKKHGNLIVAVDFDSTIYPFRAPTHRFPKVIQLLRDCKDKGFKIIIFSASAKSRHSLIEHYCKENNIPFDAINKDLVFFRQYPEEDWSCSKIYYNILLDDKAGLSCAYRILRYFVDSLK